MGVYGTQTALATPTLDDKVVLSDAGITKASTLQEILDVLVPAIPPADLDITAADVGVVDSGENFTATDVEGALEELADGLAGAGAVDSVNGETGVVVIDAGDVDIVDAGTYFTGTDVEAALQELGAAMGSAGNESVNTVAATGAAETLDMSAYGAHRCTMDQNCTFTFSNPPAAGEIRSVVVLLSGAFDPTWPGSVSWITGFEPTYTPLMVYVFTTIDGGTTWYGSAVGTTIDYEYIVICATDETSSISTTGQKVAFRMPFAMTLTDVRASLTTASASGTFTVDVNETGTSILSTKLTFDSTEKTTTTAATPRVISDTALAEDAEITIDVDNTGSGAAAGLKVTLIGYRVT